MNLDSFIYEAIFEEKPKFKIFYELVWEQFKEDGFVVTDEDDMEIDSVLKAVALQNIVGEFNYRMYDEINETGLEDVTDYLASLNIYEDEITAYCEANSRISVDPDDFETTVKNALDCTTEIVANKLL